MKSGVILGFRIAIDYSKIGYHFYRVDVYLKNLTKKQKIIDYIESNPNLVGRIISLGYVDLELIFFLNDIKELHDIMTNLISKFPDSIKNYTCTTNTQTYKYQYLPEELL